MPKEPDLTGAEVVNICSDYMNETDILLVEKALACASLAHADQYRASGEAYFVHPTQVAGILAKLKLDAVTVSLEGAISDLLELTGERATEAVVDSVFAQFCVGK